MLPVQAAVAVAVAAPAVALVRPRLSIMYHYCRPAYVCSNGGRKADVATTASFAALQRMASCTSLLLLCLSAVHA